MKRTSAYLLLTLLLVSCGTLRRGNESTTAASSEILTREIGLSEVPSSEKPSGVTAVQEEKPVVTGKADNHKQEETNQGSLSEQVIAYARTFLGTPYKLGASGPKVFDCSGYTRYVFKHFGYELTQYTGAQFNEGREVPGYSDLQKGDLVFFGKRGSVRNIGHVGIVVSIDETRGSFRFIHASTSGGVVESESTQPYYMMRYIGARRILPDEPRRN